MAVSASGISNDNNSPDYITLLNTLNNLQNWTITTHVTICFTKTLVMNINLFSNHVLPPSISPGPTPHQVGQSTKLLGVTVDDKQS